MKISGSGRVDTPSVRRGGRVGSGGGGSFSVDSSGDAQKAAGLTGAGPLAAIDTILTLQSVDDALSGRTRAVQHGEQLLHLLDELRDGLLAGGIPRLTLNRLALAVSSRRDGFTDPKLQNVLDEIELRARVELAKLEQAEQPNA